MKRKKLVLAVSAAVLLGGYTVGIFGQTEGGKGVGVIQVVAGGGAAVDTAAGAGFLFHNNPSSL